MYDGFYTRITILVLLAFFFNKAAAQKKVFLVAGQSNAAGVGDSLLSPICAPGTAYEFLGLTGQLRPLKDPVGENAFGFEAAKTGSAWLSFAKRYYELPRDTIIIIQAAKGGSSLNSRADAHQRWDANGDLAKAAIEKTRLCLRAVHSSLDGIIWIQGESDAFYINKKQLTQSQYKDALKHLIQRFRYSFGSQLNFYIVQTGWALGESTAGYEAVQRAQEAICAEVSNTYLVYNLTKSFKTFGLMSDYIHYDQTGYNVLGKTIAEVIVGLEQGSDFQPFVISNDIYPNPSFDEVYL